MLARKGSFVQLTDLCLDKISRLTANPDFAHFPLRCFQRGLQVLHTVGLFRLPRNPVCRSFDGNMVINLAPCDTLTKRVWFGGYFQYDEEWFLRDFLRSDMVVIDAGANVGYMTLIVARRVQPQGAVHSFEPVGSTFDLLSRNIQENGLEKIANPNKRALGDTTGDSVFFDRCERHSDLNRRSARDEVHRPGDGWQSTEEVLTITLDDYVREKALPRVDLLKMDVEGSEMLLVKGAGQVLSRFHPTLVCEFNNPALTRLGSSSGQLWSALTGFGYTFWRYNHRSRTLRAVSDQCLDSDDTFVGTTDVDGLARHVGARIC